MAFYTRCARCGKRVEAWDKDLTHPHYCFRCDEDEDEMVEEPRSELVDEVGWLSPEGKYYPCDYDHDDTNGRWHFHKACEIVEWRYPGQTELSDFTPGGGIQDFLVRLGWIRTDVKECWYWHRPTQQQIDTLFDLYQLKLKTLPAENIRLICAWGGLKFLSKSGDNYDGLEYKLPFDEIKIDVPELKPPGRIGRP